MRVPPDQSSTLAEQAASASSGSLLLAARASHWSAACRTGRSCTRLRASVTACRKCRNSRVYWLIEPEISSSATIGGCLRLAARDISGRSARRRAFMLARKVRRMSMRWPWRMRREAPRLHLVERQHQLRDRVLGLRRSRPRSSARSPSSPAPRGRTPCSRASISISLLLALGLLGSPENSASSTRCAPACGCSPARRPVVCGTSSRSACSR